ncbi:CsiV family protein [Thiosulfativibrio zosterae]|nr:CsiV family protein [Thiosulfativibrio zosterae]
MPLATMASDKNSQPYPKYQVELLIFETTAIRGWTEETWPLIDTDIDLDGSVPAEPLNDKYLMLASQAKKLKPEIGYKILMHQAYAVYGLPEEKATRISFENYPETEWTSKVKGDFLFYKSRYPHIDVEFQVDKAIPSRVRDDLGKQQKMEIVEPMVGMPPVWRFYLKESRKVLKDEIHYIDHPLFGALVKVQPVED